MTTTSEVADSIEVVADSWHARLLKVDPQVAHHKPSMDRWSISEVVGHLVDSASNNHQRFVRVQSVDELTFPKYDQNKWVSAAHYLESDWVDLVTLWRLYNLMLAQLIRHIPQRTLQTPCTITPYDTCTLEFLVTDYLTHLEHHLAILGERLTPAPASGS